MANIINNTASITFDGTTVASNIVTTYIDLELIVSKIVDKTHALSGQTLLYTITIENPNDYEVNNVEFLDDYDDGNITYINNSFTINGTPVTPDTTNPLEYTIPSIAALSTITLQFQVTIS